MTIMFDRIGFSSGGSRSGFDVRIGWGHRVGGGLNPYPKLWGFGVLWAWARRPHFYVVSH